MLKKLFSKTEFIIALIIIVFSVVVGSVNSSFFTVANMFDLARNTIVMAIFALGVLIVLISGGIDVSFPAIAVFSMYSTAKILMATGYQGTILVPFAIAAAIGIPLGLLNAFFISYLKQPTLIVTLATMSVYRGFLMTYIGSREISRLPASMIDFSRWYLFRVEDARGAIFGLHGGILIVLGLALITWFILKKTTLGRGIYALGGDPVAAERVGFNTKAIQFFIYGFVGLIAAIGGVTHSSLVRIARPMDIVGTELNVIAAVVIGGARITGGHGSVIGTLLGVILVTLMNTSLILLGISSFWQSVVLGLLILLGTGIPAYQSKRRALRAGGRVIE